VKIKTNPLTTFPRPTPWVFRPIRQKLTGQRRAAAACCRPRPCRWMLQRCHLFNARGNARARTPSTRAVCKRERKRGDSRGQAFSWRSNEGMRKPRYFKRARYSECQGSREASCGTHLHSEAQFHCIQMCRARWLPAVAAATSPLFRLQIRTYRQEAMPSHKKPCPREERHPHLAPDLTGCAHPHAHDTRRSVVMVHRWSQP